MINNTFMSINIITSIHNSFKHERHYATEDRLCDTTVPQYTETCEANQIIQAEFR